MEGTSATGVKFKETFYTSAEGIILVEGLPIGYVLSEEKTVVIKADATTEAAIENKLQRGSLISFWREF